MAMQQIAVPTALSEPDRALVAALAERGAALIVRDTETYAHAGVLLRDIKSAGKALDDRRKGITTPLDAAKKAVMDLFRAPTEALDRAEATIKRGLADYESEQRRIAEAKAETERRRLREEEAARQKQAELERVAREEEERLRLATVKAAADKAELDAALSGSIGAEFAAQDAADAVETERKAAEARQREADYQEVVKREEAAKAANRVQAAAPIKLAGISYRETWHAEVIDPRAVPREYLIPDAQRISAVVRATKGTVQIAGVKIWSDNTPAARAA